jgi:hypothetical protein
MVPPFTASIQLVLEGYWILYVTPSKYMYAGMLPAVGKMRSIFAALPVCIAQKQGKKI